MEYATNETAAAAQDVPAQLNAPTADAVLGAATAPIRVGPKRVLSSAEAGRGAIVLDEYHLFRRALTPNVVATLAFRR